MINYLNALPTHAMSSFGAEELKWKSKKYKDKKERRNSRKRTHIKKPLVNLTSDQLACNCSKANVALVQDSISRIYPMI